MFCHRWLPLILAGLAIVLTSPSVRNGLTADDLFHRDILLDRERDESSVARLPGMFTFMNGDPERNRALIARGGLPWWTSEHVQIAFFRPISELTHRLDYRLWPNRVGWMHVHSLAWYAALVALATALYRKAMVPVWVAGFAAFLYAVDDAHGVPVGWLANRNAVVAAVFGVMTIIVHLRWRREGWKPGAILGPVGLLVALFASEAGVATGAYILAYELTMDRHSIRSRALAVAPYAAVGLGWLMAYRLMDFGASGSGAYLNPGQDPLLFARALLMRMPVLLCGQWLRPEADLFSHLPKPEAYMVLGTAVVVVLAIAIVLYPLLRRDSSARFWCLGMVLSLVPVCATFPMNRLLVFVGLGAMGLIAQFLAAWMVRAEWLPSSKAWRGLAGVVAVLLILDRCISAPLLLPVTSTRLARVTAAFLDRPVAAFTDENDLHGKTVFLLNPPSAFMGLLIPNVIADLGRPLPARTHVLSSGLHMHIDVRRADEFSLEFAPMGGFASAELDRLFRGSHDPMQVGQRVELDGLSVEVLSLTDDKRPAQVRFVFDRPLDDPSLVFLQHHGDGIARFALPATGETVRLRWYIRPHW